MSPMPADFIGFGACILLRLSEHGPSADAYRGLGDDNGDHFGSKPSPIGDVMSEEEIAARPGTRL